MMSFLLPIVCWVYMVSCLLPIVCWLYVVSCVTNRVFGIYGVLFVWYIWCPVWAISRFRFFFFFFFLLFAQGNNFDAASVIFTFSLPMISCFHILSSPMIVLLICKNIPTKELFTNV